MPASWPRHRRALALAASVAVAGASAFWLTLSLHRASGGGHDPAAIARLAVLYDQRGPGPITLAAFLAGAVAVMLPCLLQMSLVLTSVVTGLSPEALGAERPSPWRRALAPVGAFLGGYAAVYALAGAAVGAAGQAFLAYLPWLRAASGVLLLALGVSLLGLLPYRPGSRCRGPLGFLLRLPAGRGPAAMGASFAVYCAGCCGPYLHALALLAGGTGSPARSAGVVLLFAFGTLLPLLLPALSFRAAATLSRQAALWAPALSRASGCALVLLGTLLVVEGPLLAALASHGPHGAGIH